MSSYPLNAENMGFRWKEGGIGGGDAHLDLYPSAGSGANYFLFAQVLNGEVASRPQEWFLERKNEFEKAFPGKKIEAIGGSLKTKRGSEPLPPWEGNPENQDFIGSEGELRFYLELKEVLNPGWFLDQTKNRAKLLRTLSEPPLKGGRVLNLFSYTGSFSLAAAFVGAQETVSVDTSNRYLKWEKKNQSLLPSGNSTKMRILNEDARDFVAKALRRGEKFQAVILDPPTFSKGKKEFDISRDYFHLLRECIPLLGEEAVLLASMNDSRITDSFVENEFEEISEEEPIVWESGERGLGFSSRHPLKSFWIKRKP